MFNELFHEQEPAPSVVLEFQGEYRFLSNMWELEVPLDTDCGPVKTTEHAYQMAKFNDPEAKREIAKAETGIRAKKIATRLIKQGVEIKEGWLDEKESAMLELNRQKFQLNPELGEKLIETDGKRLEEGNRWGDTFWGVSPPGSGIGENRLGRILELIRDELSSRQS